MKEWQVEDAGGGCRAFSEVIVLACQNTGELFSSTIPLTWDDGSSLEEKACSQLIQMMSEARVTRDDFFYVCSGNIFHKFHDWLSKNEYNWEVSKIDGLAHEYAEHLFHCQVVSAGFPANIQLVERNYRDYYRAVERWIYADESRLALLKDREVRLKPAETRYILKGNGKHIRSCHKCSKKITPYTPIVVYRHRESGRRVRRYYHLECTPVKPLKSTLESATVTWAACNVDGIVLGAGKEACPCVVCGQPVLPGEKTFYGYWQEKILLTGHLSCFLNGKQPLLAPDS
ncbi:MAG: hypothetical protein BWY80_00048 [Firmicutes bacterium ADurb.Bin456]|nr:MAG: hypothetical protein BWY80_00048 [Firmicutes bacterium ADurb.Bin456]